MNQEPTYHIDVTEEEARLFTDLPKVEKPAQKIKPLSVSFGKVFSLVLGIHVIAAAALFGVSLKPTKTNEDKPADKPKESVYTAEQQSTALQSKNTKLPPTPTPTPAKVVDKPAPAVKTSTMAKEYVVKQGDTIYSIAQKYKLNVDRLIKINDIKDVNKIQIGQTLKFM